MTKLAFPLALAFFAAPVLATSYSTLALPALNTDIRTYSSGSGYAPLFAQTQTFNGVPFDLAVDAQGHTAFAGGILDIPVGVFGVTSAHTSSIRRLVLSAT